MDLPENNLEPEELELEGWVKTNRDNGSIGFVEFNDGTYSNDDRLGAIGDIQFVIDNTKLDDDILVLATDNIFEFELTDFYNFYKEKNAPCVCVREEKYEALKRLGVAELDGDMKMIGFEEKPAEPKGKYAAYAEYIYPKAIVPEIKEYLESGNSCDAPGNLVKYFYSKMPLYGYEFTGDCFDIGTHESLAEVNEIYNNK